MIIPLDSAIRRRRAAKRPLATNAALGAAVARSAAFISLVRRARKRASPELAIAIEAAMEGEVTRGDLRPDLWPVARSA
jgi:DNA-binding transcriptional regulator YdaS (Cro superfamily)